MRIIIELDPNNQQDIKTMSQGYGEQQTNLIRVASPMDAGIANMSMPEITSIPGNDTSTGSVEMLSKTNGQSGIDAGSFNAGQSDSDSESIMTSHQNDLQMAVSSGSALNAGIAKITGAGIYAEIMAPLDTGADSFDRSKAMSAGEFMNNQDLPTE